MAKQVSNVDIISDSWENFILLTNSLLHSMSTEIITANTTYANTGNNTISRTAQLWGTLGSNNIVVTNTLRGGNVNGSFANLTINTNTNISNTTASNVNLFVSNSTSFTYINPVGGYFGNTTAKASVNTTSIIIQSNSTVNTNITPTQIFIANSISSANIGPTSFRTGLFVGNSTAVGVGANLVGNSSALLVNGSSTSSVLTAIHLKIGNSTVNSTSNATILHVTNSTSTASLSPSTLTVGNTIATTNTLNISNDYKIDIAANGNIGSGTGSPIKVYGFTKADWSSGKFEVQVKNNGNTQITELVLAHDGTNAYVAVYGTVASPVAGNNSVSPLGTFTANVNNANVDLLLTQTTSSSAVKVVAHLIK